MIRRKIPPTSPLVKGLKRCPNCGGEKIKRQKKTTPLPDGRAEREVSCSACGAEWFEIMRENVCDEVLIF